MTEKLMLMGAGSLFGYFLGSFVDQRSIKKMFFGDNKKTFDEINKQLTFHNPDLMEFEHNFGLNEDLYEAKFYQDNQRKQIYLIYNPMHSSQGHEGIVHGGFTYGITRMLAQLYLEKYNLPIDYKNIYIRYKRPSFVNKVYVSRALTDHNGDIVVEIKDKSDRLIAFSVVKYDHVEEGPVSFSRAYHVTK